MINSSRCLLDTTILMRLANENDILYSLAVRAIEELDVQSISIFITPQNLIEFRNVATRLIIDNGLGLSVKEVEIQAAEFENVFNLLTDTAEIYDHWKRLVLDAGIIGK